jgi:hypothetical protein
MTLGKVVHACDLSTQEAEAGGLRITGQFLDCLKIIIIVTLVIRMLTVNLK